MKLKRITLILKWSFVSLALLAYTARAADALDAWTTSNSGPQDPMRAIAFGNGQFVGVGAAFDANGNPVSSPIISSLDSFNWTPKVSGATNVTLSAVAYGNGQFVAVGDQPDPSAPIGYSAAIVTSPDGKTWTTRSAGVSNATLRSVVFGGGEFVAAGNTGSSAIILSSSDGVNWTPWNYLTPNIGPGIRIFRDIAYGNGMFVAIGNDSLNVSSVVTSSDGINWSRHTEPEPGTGGSVVTFGGNLFAAGSASVTGRDRHNVSSIWSSSDGISWVRQQSYTNQVQGPLDFSFASYGAGIFILGISLPGAFHPPIYSSVDGTNWVTHNLPTNISTVTFGGGRFVGLEAGVAAQSGLIGKLGASLVPAGGLNGTVSGVTGQAFAIETSIDLSHWGILRNVTVTSNGIAQFTDQISTAFQRRFYEASVLKR